MIPAIGGLRRRLLRAAGGNDANTVFLFHADGLDASTSFTDSAIGGNAPHPITAHGNAQLDDAQSVFGGSSMLLDGSGDWASAADSPDWHFGSGPFTIDGRARFASVASDRSLVTQWHLSGNQRGFLLRWVQSTSALRFIYSTNGTNSTFFDFSWSPVINTWYHFHVTRSGDDLYAGVDGAQIGSTQDVTGVTFHDSTGALEIGVFNGGTNPHNGHLDEIRISKGVARFGAGSYTVPTKAYA